MSQHSSRAKRNDNASARSQPVRWSPEAGTAGAGGFARHARAFALLQELLGLFVSSRGVGRVLHLRNRHILAFDIILLTLTPVLAVTLTFEGFRWWPGTLGALAIYTVPALIVKIACFYLFGMYARYWPQTTLSDVWRLATTIGYATVVLTGYSVVTHSVFLNAGLALSRSVPLIDGMLTLLIAGGLRFSLRGLYDWHRRSRRQRSGRRVLVVGAGEAGMMTVREISANPNLMLQPVAFVDDDPAKVGTLLYGLPVVGTSDDLPNLVDLYHIQRIIVAVPSSPLPRQQELVNLCRQTGVVTDTLAGIYEILAGHKVVSPLPQVDINRVLHREPVVVNSAALGPILTGKVVLVTGAGGSIGSELCRQIAGYRPAEIILLGHGENSIFEIALDLSMRYPDLVTRQVIADIRDADRINWAVRTYRPAVIYHAAAHKHVPLMEKSVAEGVLNNVHGTRNVLRAAERYGVDHFVLISSDKAIRPVNILGATKRIGEMLTVAAAQRTRRPYIVVRFGNVLGSRGSVIPIFQRQIAAGGPVTVTHPDMYRYFMTIPEAVQLVLQATVLAKGGEVYVLDMGKPVRILDLASDLIRLFGFEPEKEIDILFSGVRPGEKLREELFLENEEYHRSAHEKVFVAAGQEPVDGDTLERAVDRLVLLASRMQESALIEQMCSMLPDYRPYPLAGEPALLPPCKAPDAAEPSPVRIGEIAGRPAAQASNS